MLKAASKIARKFSELEIKSMVLSEKQIRSRSPVVATEFSVGRGVRRADLVVLDGDMIGFEIKSDFDTLARLGQQSEQYLRHFDKVILTITSKHLKKSLEICPKELGIWVVCSNGTIEAIRDAKRTTYLKSCDLASILTKLEKYRLLGSVLDDEISALPGDTVRQAVLEAFQSRYKDASANFWRRSAQQGVITPESLPTLSRFAAARDAAAHRDSEIARYWAEWNANATVFFRNSCSFDV